MLTCSQIAEMYQIDPDTVRGWCASGELPAVNVAKSDRGCKPRWRVAQADLDQFLRRRSNRPARSQPTTTRAARPAKRTKSPIKFF